MTNRFIELTMEQEYIEKLIKNGDDDISLKKRLKEIEREKEELKNKEKEIVK